MASGCSHRCRRIHAWKEPHRSAKSPGLQLILGRVEGRWKVELASFLPWYLANSLLWKYRNIFVPSPFCLSLYPKIDLALKIKTRLRWAATMATAGASRPWERLQDDIFRQLSKLSEETFSFCQVKPSKWNLNFFPISVHIFQLRGG